MDRVRATWMGNGLVILLGALFVPGLRAGDQPVPPKPAATPEEAVKLLVEAAKTGDVDAFVARLGSYSRTTMEAMRAHEVYQLALDEKFGKDPDAGDRIAVKEALESFKTGTYQVRARVIDDRERVDLTVWIITRSAEGKESIREETWIVLKEPAGWKVVMPPKGVISKDVRKDASGREVKVEVLTTRQFDAQKLAAEEKLWREFGKVLAKITQDVKAGKYPSRAKAQDALEEALIPLLKETN
jgi:hypothetical protein